MKRARGFVKRVAALPGMPVMPAIALAAALLAIVTGPFGTGAIPLPERAGLWFVLMGWNLIKWQGWFAWRVKSPLDWRNAALLGTIPINAPLPLEIWLSFRLFGIESDILPIRLWLETLAISVVVFGAMWVIGSVRSRPVAPAPALAPDGLLARAGLTRADQLHAIRAEDHYCRLHLADGKSLLIHHRFGDALKELEGIEGAQVHRGAWVAADAVRGAEREGRRWRIRLKDGTLLPVSESHAAAARARGWLRPVRHA